MYSDSGFRMISSDIGLISNDIGFRIISSDIGFRILSSDIGLISSDISFRIQCICQLITVAACYTTTKGCCRTDLF